jgi:hypothetical protein
MIHEKMEQWSSDIDRKTEELKEKGAPVPVCPPHPTWTALGVNQDMVRSQLLLGYGMAKQIIYQYSPVSLHL